MMDINKVIIEHFGDRVPQTYGEAIKMYPFLECEFHEWDNRTTVENISYLLSYLTQANLEGRWANGGKCA